MSTRRELRTKKGGTYVDGRHVHFFRRCCPFATYGARSALLNDAALGVLINITYACSVNDEELFSSPPLGARTHGLPMMTDWKSLSASCGPLHTDLLCNGE